MVSINNGHQIETILNLIYVKEDNNFHEYTSLNSLEQTIFFILTNIVNIESRLYVACNSKFNASYSYYST